MAFLFSPSTMGFYDTRIPYAELPDDVIDIGEDEHERLMTAQGEGWEIFVNAKGKPDLRRRQ